jgi:DNA primase catalytic core
LRLYLDDGMWYCFGCSDRAGDVVQWTEQAEGVGWRQAIEILDSGQPLSNAWAGSSQYGGVAPTAAAGANRERPDLNRTPASRVQEVVDRAWEHCTAGPLHARAVGYLTRRRIYVTALEAYTNRFEAGHTPAYGATLVQRLLADGFGTDELVDAGLAHRDRDARVTDFYRQRLLIPIRTPEGRLSGLVGRNVGDPRWPKYKNPPRTLLYDKSVNLYQPLPAPRHPYVRVVVVEGTLDALAIACAAVHSGHAGRLCPVTQSGRELSLYQLSAVLTLYPGPVVASFDGDAAGRESNVRLARAVLSRGRDVVVIKLPTDVDPASWLASEGPNGLSLWLHDPKGLGFGASGGLHSAIPSPSIASSHSDFENHPGGSVEVEL